MEAFKCYKKASDFGSARALNNLGLMLESGFDGNAADPDKRHFSHKCSVRYTGSTLGCVVSTASVTSKKT